MFVPYKNVYLWYIIGRVVRKRNFELNENLCVNELADYYAATSTIETRIGIMGGTFNPVHNGHIKMGADAHDEFGLSKILYIPTGRPPHKKGDFIADDEHRMAMLDLAITYPYMVSSRVEIDRRGTTYAVDTLTALKKIFKEHEFYYIIGSDTLFKLTSWKEYSKVLTMTNFIVFLREGDDRSDVVRTIDFYNSTGIRRFCLANAPGLYISSSDIRFRIMNGLSLEGHLPKSVIDYIKENNVYSR